MTTGVFSVSTPLGLVPTVSICVFDPAEEVTAWVEFATDGVVEEIFTLPGLEGDLEDKVYYVVNRTVNGSTVRYLEKWALEQDCLGGLLNKNLDAHLVYQGSPTTTLTVAHLVGQTVSVWGDGKDQGTFVVSAGGTVTLSTAVSNAVVGLIYDAPFVSSKLAYQTPRGSALNKRKTIPRIGLILDHSHTQGLQYGKDFNTLQYLPLVEDDLAIDPTGQWATYDKDTIPFDGDWNTDERLCLYAMSPRNVTVLAVEFDLDTVPR